MTPIQIFINPADRLQLATTIQSLIDLMDSMEPDCDLEDGGDHEPNLGWPAGHGLPQLAKNVCHDDEREDENEHAGDILDEPEGDDEREDYDLLDYGDLTVGMLDGGSGL